MALITMRNIESAWYLRELCRELREYFLEDNISYKIIEIGSYTGESSEILAQEFPFMQLYCIDPWKGDYDDRDAASHSNFDEVEKLFTERINYLPNIVPFKGVLQDFLDEEIEGNIAFVYIDGNHQYEAVKEDIQNSINFLKPAFIAGHDYYEDDEFLKQHPHIAGVKRAVLETLGVPNTIYEDGSWIKRVIYGS